MSDRKEKSKDWSKFYKAAGAVAIGTGAAVIATYAYAKRDDRRAEEKLDSKSADIPGAPRGYRS